MNVFFELGKFLISTAVLGGLIVWFLKEYLKLRFSKELEKSKAELDSYFHKEKLKFSKLHEERALVLKELYLKLYKSHKALKVNLHDIENIATVDWELKKKNIDNTLLILDEFDDYFEGNQILFTPKLCNKIQVLREVHFDSIKIIVISYFLASSLETEMNMEERGQEYSDYEAKLKEIIQKEIPEIEFEIICEFRQILGVIE